MLRYDGSNWVETDKLQIDSAGVVKVTNSAGDVLFPTAAGTLALKPKTLTGSVTTFLDGWTEVLKLPMPDGPSATERWAGIGTLESISTAGTVHTQQFAINVYPNNREITGTASAPFGTGVSVSGGLGVTSPPELQVTTATGQTYLSVEVKGNTSLAANTPKSFYSWADTAAGGAASTHTAIVDQAALTSINDIGSLTALPNVPTAGQYDANGVLMRATASILEGLQWNNANLSSKVGLTHSTGEGFTMHYEIEAGVFDFNLVRMAVDLVDYGFCQEAVMT